MTPKEIQQWWNEILNITKIQMIKYRDCDDYDCYIFTKLNDNNNYFCKNCPIKQSTFLKKYTQPGLCEIRCYIHDFNEFNLVRHNARIVKAISELREIDIVSWYFKYMVITNHNYNHKENHNGSNQRNNIDSRNIRQ